MTEVDIIYETLICNIKKYGVEHAVSALQHYIVSGDNLGFTNDGNSRKMISALSPAEVMAESLRGILKYQIISEQRNLPQYGVNEQEVLKAIYEYKNGQRITANLKSADVEYLVKVMLDDNINDLVGMFVDNQELFECYLTLYVNLLCNYKNDMNKIDNNNSSKINNYFTEISVGEEKRK